MIFHIIFDKKKPTELYLSFLSFSQILLEDERKVKSKWEGEEVRKVKE